MTAGEIVFGILGLVVGFVVGLVTLHYTRRSTLATERSAKAGERSAAAAEALVPPTPPRVIWALTPAQGILYELRNMGTTAATGVTVTLLPANAEGLLRYPPTGPIGPGGAHEIGVLRVSGPKATSAKVECNELSDSVTLPL
ncbi:MAG TPA: hypothetical protein DGG94_16765 [Micromonosporaceae bacterium]|nr:hypothetical protein [Micromonosporaceae bacterium]